MKYLLDKIKAIDSNQLNFDNLFDHILPFDPQKIDYKAYIPLIENPHEYARNILLEDPLEVVLINWPPRVESAIHLHSGFWGYVGVLEGEALNVEYLLNKGLLKQSRAVSVKAGGLIPEPDGVIHKIANASSEDALITIHFYYPALKDLDGLKLFSLDGTIVELNAKAPSASLNLASDCYNSIKKDLFKYEDEVKGKSHIISPIIPKPNSNAIRKMILDYYSKQADNYDSSDIENDNRRKYVFAINDILVEEFKSLRPQKVLDIATGTGRRALRIKSLSKLNYDLYGLDMNSEMCELAEKRGIKSYCSDWLSVDFPDNSFDVITMLYAFGHVADALKRILFLEKVYDKLKPGGVFYFDVFNLNDPHEWGGRAISVFKEYKLDYFGYERGDVFYRRKGLNEVSFLHYFEEERLVALLESLGFSCEEVLNVGYVYESGEIMGQNQGKLFIKAVKI